MMVQTMPVGTHAVPRNTPMMPILRAHALGELKTLDTEVLRSYHDTVWSKITAHEETLQSNIARGFAAEIRQDIRWFQSIYDEISTLLTKEFNSK